MKTLSHVCTAALLVGTFAVLPLIAEPTTPAPQGEMPPEMIEAMQRMEAMSKPGEHHQHLQQWIGEWDLVVKFSMGPDGPTDENKMTASSKMIMGGRYVMEKVSGEVMDPMSGKSLAFEGMSMMGFDNYKKQYFSTWIDNMSTGMLEERGTCDGTGKVITTEGKNFDPMINAERPSKSVATIVDADHRTLEMYAPGPDGKMFKQMHISYTRKK